MCRLLTMGQCGEAAVRLRPMLIFEDKHASLLLEKAEEVLRAM